MLDALGAVSTVQSCGAKMSSTYPGSGVRSWACLPAYRKSCLNGFPFRISHERLPVLVNLPRSPRSPSHRETAQAPIHFAVLRHLDRPDVVAQVAQPSRGLGKPLCDQDRVVDPDAVG